jgi:hypothetical protein
MASDARTKVRKRIRERAEAIRREREAGRGWWAALRALFRDFDRRAEEEADRRDRERAEAQTRANRAFPPHERDFLPGGPMAGKRPPPRDPDKHPYAWLHRRRY